MTAVLLHSGVVHTFDQHDTTAEAVLVEHGRVVATGRTDELRGAGRGALEVDLGGSAVLPGLVDTHPHLLHFGVIEAPLVPLFDARDHDDIVQRLSQRARRTRRGDWVMGTPVGEPHLFIRRSWRDLAEGRLPDRTVLDRVSTRHPVLIQAWAPERDNALAMNSVALRRLGIDSGTPERIGPVHVERDASGGPSGRLFGPVGDYYSYTPFTEALWEAVPLLQHGFVLPGIRDAVAEHHRRGVTAVYENHMMDAGMIAAYRGLRDAGRLPLRVMTSQECEILGIRVEHRVSVDEALAQAAAAIELDDEHFRMNGVSLIWDGLASTGHMLTREPYPGPDGAPTLGRLQLLPEAIERVMRRCATERMRLNMIVGGPRAHDENLLMLERLARDHDLASLNWLLVHSPFLEPGHIARYRALGIDLTTTMMFAWGKGDLYRERLGEPALSDLLPLRRLLDAGMTVAGGSDWGPRSPFEQIALAVTHEFGRSGFRNDGPAQAITRREAIAMWTRDAARLLHWPELGSLRPGSYADLVVLDRDPLACDDADLPGTTPVLTLIGGAVGYDAGGFAGGLAGGLAGTGALPAASG